MILSHRTTKDVSDSDHDRVAVSTLKYQGTTYKSTINALGTVRKL